MRPGDGRQGFSPFDHMCELPGGVGRVAMNRLGSRDCRDAGVARRGGGGGGLYGGARKVAGGIGNGRGGGPGEEGGIEAIELVVQGLNLLCLELSLLCKCLKLFGLRIYNLLLGIGQCGELSRDLVEAFILLFKPVLNHLRGGGPKLVFREGDLVLCLGSRALGKSHKRDQSAETKPTMHGSTFLMAAR